MALVSIVGWSQTVTQPTLALSNPSGTASSNVAVCSGGGTVVLNWSATGASTRVELRQNTIAGPLVNAFGVNGVLDPLPASPATLTLPAGLTLGTTYHLVVITTTGMTSDSKSVTIIPKDLPASPAFTMTPSTVCVQPGNASIATATSPNTTDFFYTWSKVEGAPAANSTLSTTSGTTTTITPTSVGTTDITLTAAFRSMSCGTTATTQTLTAVTATVPTINMGGVAGITVESPAIFVAPAPYATFPTIPVADYEVCEGSTIRLSSYCPPGQTATWFRGGVEIGTGSPINIVPVNPGGPAYNEYTYEVRCRLTGSINCESEGRQITVKTIKQSSLVPAPTLLTASTCQLPSDWSVSPTTISVTKTANCPAGSVAQWYNNSGDALGSPAATGPTRTLSVNLLNAGTTNWYVTCKRGLCESASKTTASFTVVPKPGTPTITNTNGDFACANTASGPIPGPTSLVLTALCAPGTTANWYVVSTTSGFPVTPPTGDPNVGIVGTGGSYTHASAAGTTTYKVRCKDNTTGCWSELSTDRTITINVTAAAPTGTFAWSGSATQICMSLTPGATSSPNLASLTCAGGTSVKWYNEAGTSTIPAPSNLDIFGAVNPGPNPDGTLVRTFTYQVSCEDGNADAGAGNICESPKRTVAITVVRPPAAPTMTLDLNNTVAGTDGAMANNLIVCQGPNNTTVVVSNCPTLTGWQTEWQIVGTVFTQGSGSHWTTNAPQTDDAGGFNDNNILLVNASNFDPTFTTAAAGWTIRARCHDGNIPSGCQDGAITEVTGVKVNVKENPQALYMQSAPSNDPLTNVIASGKNLCLGSTVKLNQVEPLMIGGQCSGIIQFQRRFRATTSATWPEWSGILGENTPFTDAPLTEAGEYQYRIRCNGLCPGDWSAPQSVLVSATPAVTFAATPATTTCVEPNATQPINLALSGCDATNSNLGPVVSQLYRVTRVMTEEGVVGSTTTTFDVPASVLGVTTPNPYTDANTAQATITASASNSKTRTYVYTVKCVRVYGSGGANNSPQCEGAESTQTVTIRTKPAPPTALAVDATPICQGGMANLSGTCAEGTIEWFNITDNVVLGTGSPISTGVLMASHSYKARCVVPGCNGNYAVSQVSVSVIVAAKPVLSATGMGLLCPTPAITPSVKTTTLSATGCSGAQENIVWSSPAGTHGSGAGSGSNYNLVVTTGTPAGGEVGISSTGGTVVFTATCTRPGGCTSTETITVTILPDPQISITPATQSVCVGSPLTLAAASVLGPIGGHSWTGSGSLVTPLNQNDASISAPVGGATLAMTGMYNFTANYQGCVFSTATAPAKTATVTVKAVPAAPTIGGTGIYCASSSVTMTSNCAGTTNWMPAGPTVTAPASGSATYTATCTVDGCTSPVSNTVTITSRPFSVTIIDVGASANKTNGAAISNWNRIFPSIAAVPAVLPVPTGSQAGPDFYATTPSSRRTFDNYQTPRFWTVDVAICDPAVAANVKSVSYEMYLLNPVTEAIQQSFNTVENNAPYLQFGNAGGGYTTLYTLNDPTYGFYSPTGVYDAGFPKGKYNWRIRAYDKPGIDYGPYPSNVTKNPDPTAAILAEGNYYIEITNASGARASAEVVEATFATVTPNPVTRTLTLSINGAKGQDVKLNLVDASGRSLMNRSITPDSNTHREEVDMSNNNTGMYFMQVTSPTKRATLKVLKVSQD